MKLKNIVKSSILEIIFTLLCSACIVKKVDKKLNELAELFLYMVRIIMVPVDKEFI